MNGIPTSSVMNGVPTSSVMLMTPQGLIPAPVQSVGHGDAFLASNAANQINSSSSQALAPYVGGTAAQQLMLASQGMLGNAAVPQQFGAHLQQQQQSLQQQQPVAAPPSLDSQLAPILVSENRQQNTEVRMSIDKVLTKMDEIRVAMTSLEQKVKSCIELKKKSDETAKGFTSSVPQNHASERNHRFFSAS